MSMKYIRETYGVPARRGAWVKFTGNPHKCPSFGTVTGSRNQYINVRMDGDIKSGKYHPEWRIEYLA